LRPRRITRFSKIFLSVSDLTPTAKKGQPKSVGYLVRDVQVGGKRRYPLHTYPGTVKESEGLQVGVGARGKARGSGSRNSSSTPPAFGKVREGKGELSVSSEKEKGGGSRGKGSARAKIILCGGGTKKSHLYQQKEERALVEVKTNIETSS